MDAVSKVAELELAEKEKMKDKVAKILKHGCSVFINRQLIYNYPEQLFADAGVMAIEHADFEGVERLALVTGKFHFLGVHCLFTVNFATSQEKYFTRSRNFGKFDACVSGNIRKFCFPRFSKPQYVWALLDSEHISTTSFSKCFISNVSII